MSVFRRCASETHSQRSSTVGLPLAFCLLGAQRIGFRARRKGVGLGAESKCADTHSWEDVLFSRDLGFFLGENSEWLHV